MNSRDIHKKIHTAVTILEKDSKYPSIPVTSISKLAKVDMRTVKLHLDLMDFDGVGCFCDAEKKTFTIKNVKNDGSNNPNG